MKGGRLRWEAFSLVGTWVESMLGKVNIQKALVGAVGLTLEEGLTDVTEEEAEVKRAMVAAAREVVAVIDHTKWGRVALSTFCPLDPCSGTDPRDRGVLACAPWITATTEKAWRKSRRLESSDAV